MSYSYFDLIPTELTSIIISYLKLKEFINFVENSSNINWGFIHSLKFGFYRNIDQNEYLRLLGIEKVKDTFNLKDSVQTIDNSDYTLDLSERYLHENDIPEEIGDLVNLRFLDLHKNNIRRIPPAIFNLKNLQRLNLSNNEITVIPPEIKNLVNLIWLSLNNNKITVVPVPTFIDNLVNLAWLYIAGNPIEFMPPEILDVDSRSGDEFHLQF